MRKWGRMKTKGRIGGNRETLVRDTKSLPANSLLFARKRKHLEEKKMCSRKQKE